MSNLFSTIQYTKNQNFGPPCIMLYFMNNNFCAVLPFKFAHCGENKMPAPPNNCSEGKLVGGAPKYLRARAAIFGKLR